MSLSVMFFLRAPLTVRTKIGAYTLHHSKEKDFIDLIKKQVAEQMHHDDDKPQETDDPKKVAQELEAAKRIEEALAKRHQRHL